jgi:hypothetical protein
MSSVIVLKATQFVITCADRIALKSGQIGPNVETHPGLCS